MADVLMNVPFHVGTTIDEEQRVSTKITFYDRDNPADELVFAFDRDATVTLIEALRVALEVVEASQSSN